jgi:hypothetical protein
VTGYGLDDREVRVFIPVGSRIFSFPHHADQLWVPPTLFSVDTRALSLGIEVLGCEADHTPPTSAKVKKTWIYTFTSPYIFMA